MPSSKDWAVCTSHMFEHGIAYTDSGSTRKTSLSFLASPHLVEIRGNILHGGHYAVIACVMLSPWQRQANCPPDEAVRRSKRGQSCELECCQS